MLSEKQKEIVDRMKFSNGDFNIIPEIDKSYITNDSVLIVGLGGTGIDTMLRVKSRVKELVKKNPDSRNYSTHYNDNIGFIAVDSDYEYFGNTPKKQYRGTYVENDEQLFLDRENKLGKWIEENMDSEPLVSWVNPNLYSRCDIYNSRQRNRACLFYNYNDILKKFNEVIKRLLRSNANNLPVLKVFVISSLDGMTGSGVFLDIAYIIRKAYSICTYSASNDIGYCSNLTLWGYFTTYNDDGDYGKSNIYASLKELDYWMSAPSRGVKWDQVYTAKGDKILCSYEPFDLVSVVSNAESFNRDKALVTISEDILATICNHSNLQVFSPFSKYNDLEFFKHSFLSNLENNGHLNPVGYNYRAIGNSGVIMPTQYIMTSLASKLINAVIDMKNKHGEPTTKEVELLLTGRYFALDGASLKSKICANDQESFENLLSDSDISSYAAVKKAGSVSDVSVKFEDMLKRKLENVRNNISSKAFFDDIKENFTNQLYCFFENKCENDIITGEPATYGPFFANDILAGTVGGKELNFLCFFRKTAEDLRQSCIYAENKIMPKLEERAKLALDEVQRVLIKNRRYEEYLHSMVELYEFKYQCKLCIELSQVYLMLYDYVTEVHHYTTSVVCEILETYKKCFDERIECYSDEELMRSAYGSIIDRYAVTYHEIDEQIGNLSVEICPDEFYEFIRREINMWTSEDRYDFNPNDSFLSYIYFKYYSGVCYNLDLESILLSNRGADEVIETLKNSAKPDFKTRSYLEESLFLNEADSNRTLSVSVPNSCLNINSYLSTSQFYSSKVTKYFSSKDITFFSSSILVPLYICDRMEAYEYFYERDIHMPRFTHLCESESENWINLPNLCPPSTYRAGYSNGREEERVIKCNEIFDKAVEYGIIHKSDDGHYFVAAVGDELINLYRSRTTETARLWFSYTTEIFEKVASEVKKYETSNKF